MVPRSLGSRPTLPCFFRCRQRGAARQRRRAWSLLSPGRTGAAGAPSFDGPAWTPSSPGNGWRRGAPGGRSQRTSEGRNPGRQGPSEDNSFRLAAACVVVVDLTGSTFLQEIPAHEESIANFRSERAGDPRPPSTRPSWSWSARRPTGPRCRGSGRPRRLSRRSGAAVRGVLG